MTKVFTVVIECDNNDEIQAYDIQVSLDKSLKQQLDITTQIENMYVVEII